MKIRQLFLLTLMAGPFSIGLLQAINVHFSNESGKTLKVDLYSEHNTKYSNNSIEDKSSWVITIDGNLKEAWWSDDNGATRHGSTDNAVSDQPDTYLNIYRTTKGVYILRMHT